MLPCEMLAAAAVFVRLRHACRCFLASSHPLQHHCSGGCAAFWQCNAVLCLCLRQHVPGQAAVVAGWRCRLPLCQFWGAVFVSRSLLVSFVSCLMFFSGGCVYSADRTPDRIRQCLCGHISSWDNAVVDLCRPARKLELNLAAVCGCVQTCAAHQ